MRFTLVAVSAAALATITGCSEPVPQSPDGAFFISTTQDDPLKCKITGHTAQVGSVDPSAINTTVTDGTNGTNVDCSVLNATAPYEVRGKIDDTSIDGTGNFLEISIPSISPGATKDAPAAGAATISAPWSGSAYSGDCNFYFEEGTDQTVASGKIWVSFNCPGLQSNMSTCPLKQGFAVFQNCLTEAPSEE